MTLALVQGMENTPNACAICAGNPIDEDGSQRPAIFAEGVDIDWGNSLYICLDCANIIASLVHRPDGEYVEQLEAKHEALMEAHVTLEREHEELQGELDKIREGSSALKRVRETARS